LKKASDRSLKRGQDIFGKNKLKAVKMSKVKLMVEVDQI
jgi:hypothetical protein